VLSPCVSLALAPRPSPQILEVGTPDEPLDIIGIQALPNRRLCVLTPKKLLVYAVNL